MRTFRVCGSHNSSQRTRTRVHQLHAVRVCACAARMRCDFNQSNNNTERVQVFAQIARVRVLAPRREDTVCACGNTHSSVFTQERIAIPVVFCARARPIGVSLSLMNTAGVTLKCTFFTGY